MARMHSRKKGKSGSKRPLISKKRVWIKYSPAEMEKIVEKLANEGKTPSQIGMILRDSYGIPDVREVNNKKLNKTLKEKGLKPELPEDLNFLIKKEIRLFDHLEKNKKDMAVKRGLQLTESKIMRLAKYYKRKGVLPSNWKYDREKAKLLIS